MEQASNCNMVVKKNLNANNKGAQKHTKMFAWKYASHLASDLSFIFSKGAGKALEQ